MPTSWSSLQFFCLHSSQLLSQISVLQIFSENSKLYFFKNKLWIWLIVCPLYNSQPYPRTAFDFVGRLSPQFCCFWDVSSSCYPGRLQEWDRPGKARGKRKIWLLLSLYLMSCWGDQQDLWAGCSVQSKSWSKHKERYGSLSILDLGQVQTHGVWGNLSTGISFV